VTIEESIRPAIRSSSPGSPEIIKGCR